MDSHSAIPGSLMRAVVGLSVLALGSAASNAAPTTMMSASAFNKTISTGSCGSGGRCVTDPSASVIDIKTARAMAAAEIDMDGQMAMNDAGIASSKTSTITIMNGAVPSLLEQALKQFRLRDNRFRVINDAGIDVSPQAKAQNWLKNNFAMSLVKHKTMSHSAAIAERYALAVFFYSLGGEQWEMPLDFMSNTDVCEWTGMVSTGYYEDESAKDSEDDEDDYDEETHDDMDDVFYGYDDDDYERFAEAGVVCDGSGSVVSLSIPHHIGMEGPIPAEIDYLANLQVLDLQQQSIEGTIPAEIRSLTKLRRLSIQDTAVSGTIPTELALLTNLEELSLIQNHLWGRMPEELGRKLEKMTSLQLSQNMLTGSIPESFGLMAELETFDLSRNQLSGVIAPSLFYFLTKVHTISFSNNELTGEVPAAIRHVSNMDITNLVIDFSHNKLSGSIPKEIGEMTQSLEQIFLNDNFLSGEIPKELANLRDTLMTFHVQNNELTGVMPLELFDMPWMFYVNVSGNNLVGSLDDILCNDRDKEEFSMYRFTADCGEDGDAMPEIICSCCTLCCVDGQPCEEDDQEM